jgi:hypothetical protein
MVGSFLFALDTTIVNIAMGGASCHCIVMSEAHHTRKWGKLN